MFSWSPASAGFAGARRARVMPATVKAPASMRVFFIALVLPDRPLPGWEQPFLFFSGARFMSLAGVVASGRVERPAVFRLPADGDLRPRLELRRAFGVRQ